jgi:hypothetical protein
MANEKKRVAKQYKKKQLGKPHAILAVVAEKVLKEEDKVISLVRVVDKTKLTFPPPVPDEVMPKAGSALSLQLYFAAIIKSGGFVGTCKVDVFQTNPSGVRNRFATSNNVEFDGAPDNGASFILPLVVIWDKDGYYWIEGEIDGREVFRTPLHVSLELPAEEGKK